MESATIASDHQAVFPAIVDPEVVRAIDSEEVTISFYENEVPAFVDVEMEQLYENVYTSLSRLRIYNEVGNASTYVASKGGKAIAVFLFRCIQGEVTVLNKQIRIDQEEIRRFTHAIFATFGSVNVISFNAIQTQTSRLLFPHQRCYYMSDVALNLPATEAGYMASLGKTTRSNLKRHMNRLKRENTSFDFEVYMGGEAGEQHIRRIIELSTARMAIKYKDTYFDEEGVKRVISLAKVCGFVCVATIDGRVCAGQIGYCVGKNYFLHVIAHDPMYDSYRLGTICFYLSICECIARGGKEVRFGGSTHRYKFDFLGVCIDFDCLTIYRSHAHLLLNGHRIFKTAFKAYIRQTKLWFLLAERRDSLASRVAARLVHRLRNWKRSGGVLFARRN